MLRGEILFRLEGLAQKRCEAAAHSLDGLIQSIGCRDTEDLFCRGIEPTNHRLFIGCDDAGRNRSQKCFGEGFLECDLFIEQCVLQDGGDVFRQEHQTFEIVVIEALARDTATKEKPADDTAACVQRDDDFGAEAYRARAASECVPLDRVSDRGCFGK